MTAEFDRSPKRWRIKIEKGSLKAAPEAEWFYGCYFPGTDLNVNEMGNRSTGFQRRFFEWIDEPSDWMKEELDKEPQ